jgi:molecular chaperone HtpG
VEGTVALYSRRVLIQAETKEMLPQWLRFMEGVIDSEDLPLNVSREMLQGTQTATRIRKTLTSRFIKEVNDLAANDAEKFARFWQEFGLFFKEGIAVDPGAKDDILPLLRFHSTHGSELTTLKGYVERMAADQNEIYYVLASDATSAKQSPHLDAVQSRGLEALLLSDMVDPFMLQHIREFDGKKLRNLDDPDVELPGQSDATESAIDDQQLLAIVEGFKAVLGERISGVQASNVLRNHPIRLVASGNSDYERMQRLLNREEQAPVRKVEINRAHPIIAGVAQRLQHDPNDPVAQAVVEQLYASAMLLDGMAVDPAELVARMQTIMQAAVK